MLLPPSPSAASGVLALTSLSTLGAALLVLGLVLVALLALIARLTQDPLRVRTEDRSRP